MHPQSVSVQKGPSDTCYRPSSVFLRTRYIVLRTEAEFDLFLPFMYVKQFSSVREPVCLEMVQIALLPLEREKKAPKVYSPAYRATSFTFYA